MNTRLQRYRVVKDDNGGFGSGAARHEAEGTPVWAQRVSETGRQLKEGAELFASYDAEFVVHIEVACQEGWQVRDVRDEGRLYRVETVVLNRQRGLRTLKCKKVNL